jgi:hypothetical protein
VCGGCRLMVVDAAARRRLHLNAEEAELRALQAGAPPLQLTVDSTTVHLASDGGGFELSCPHDQLRPLAFQVCVPQRERERERERWTGWDGGGEALAFKPTTPDATSLNSFEQHTVRRYTVLRYGSLMATQMDDIVDFHPARHLSHLGGTTQIYLLDTFALQPLPLWLVATPTAGVIHPGGSATVGVTVEKGSLPSPPPSSTAVLCVRYSDYAACAQQVVEELHIHVHLWS